MSPEQFAQLASRNFNRIPVFREVLADLDTPLSVYFKVASGPNSYLLESVHGGEKWGRYSIIGLPCRTLLRVTGHATEVVHDGKVVERHEDADPLAFIESFQARYRVPELDELPRFTGGLVGYFAYDTVRLVEPRLDGCAPPDALGNPDVQLLLSEDLVVFDNLLGKMTLLTHADPAEPDAYDAAVERLDGWFRAIREESLSGGSAENVAVPDGGAARGGLQTEFGQEAFEAAVERIKEYILDGDVMQVVISQRMSAPYDLPPIDLYRALRCLNPSPYMFFVDMGGFQIIGSSPEILVRAERGEITVRPIAGTRPRGADDEADRALEAELLADPKEIAEHLMLIDLGRNDVGRVACTGSVELTEKMVIERYSHVMHIVSNVTGQMKEGCTAMDALRATLPAGTLSGAPKIRAMEIIDELEPVKRGIYGGAVGYLAWNGNLDTAIAIRTAVVQGGRLYLQAGAGIVADSVPRNEWEETLNKGRAVFRAVEMAQAGVDRMPGVRRKG